MFKNVDRSKISPVRDLKEYVLSKSGIYTERMQKSLYSATQKYIGDCDEQKIIYIKNIMTRIISTPIANIFVGEVSDEIYFFEFFFFLNFFINLLLFF